GVNVIGTFEHKRHPNKALNKKVPLTFERDFF
ncbi:MAG: hypothetical protein K0S12_900, partial [Bacteroidetes bacterium]|nr:hypothetical protein [Bacteroidota bacterium]